MQVKDLELKTNLTMTSDPYDIEVFMDSLTEEEKNNMVSGIGTLWVDTNDGGYGEAYYCPYSVPHLVYQVYKI